MMNFPISNLFLLFIIIFTSFLFLGLSSSFDIPTQYSSILGPNHDKVPSHDEAIKLFQLWRKEHGRDYNDLEEMTKKFEIFHTNLKHSTETNAKRKSHHDFLLGLTNFADWSAQEFKEKYLHDIDMSTHVMKYEDDFQSSCNAPSYIDWRLKGAVTSVKGQYLCGSCYAFSAAGAIEGINAIVTGELMNVSEQELVDCDPNNHGCQDGSIYNAFDWVIRNGGIASASDYRYTGIKNWCSSEIPPSATIDAYYHVPPSENGLLCAVAKQPIPVCFYASTDFHLYSYGIFDGPNCPVDSTATNHCILIVGYDTIDGQDFWIAKNSWGTTWGMNGYVWIKRNTGSEYGVCGINCWALYPVKNAPSNIKK